MFAKYRPDLIGYHRRVTATLLALVALADPADVYRLELARDLPIVGVGAAAWTAFLFMDHDDRPDPCPCDPSSVPSFDQFALHQHSQAANDVSNALVGVTIAWPFVVDALTVRDHPRAMASDTVVYGEVLAVTNGLVEVVKEQALRLRPYVYQQGLMPAGSIRPRDDFYSFPSQHAANAFAGATFACTTMLRRHRRWWWCAPGYVLAAATGFLRVEAGKHFPSDVLAGGAIGTVVGVVVPLAHRQVAPSVVPLRDGAALGISGTF